MHMTTIHLSPLVEGPMCNLWFADDISLTGSSNGELQDLANRLIEQGHIYGMEVGTKKSKIMSNSLNNISADIRNTTNRMSG